MKKTIHVLLTALIGLPFSSFALERTELLPPEAIGYVRISDVNKGLEMLKKTSFGKAWNDEQIQTFLGNPLQGESIWSLIADGLAYGDEQAAKIITEELSMQEGEMVFGFDEEFEWEYSVFTMSSEDFKRSLELDEKLAELGEDGAFGIKKSTFQGVDVIEHVSGPEGEFSAWQAQLNNTFIASSDHEWLERSIIKLKQETIEEPKGTPTVTANFSAKKLVAQLLEEASAEETVEAKNLLTALGVMDVDKVTLRCELKPEAVVMDATLFARRTDKGIFKLLDTRPVKLPTAGFIPDDFSALQAGRIDLSGFWNEVKSIIETTMPEYAPQISAILMAVRQQTGVDVEIDFLANLGTEFIYYSVIDEGQAKDLVALELKNGEAFQRAVETMLNAETVKPLVDTVIDRIDFLDHTLYVSKAGVVEPAPLGIAVMKNYLLFGNEETVRQAIRSENKASPLARNPLVREMRQVVPSSAFSFSLVDAKKYVTVIAQQLDGGDGATVLPQMEELYYMLPDGVDLEKMPSAEHLASFFKSAFSYSEKTPEGLHTRLIIQN